MFKPSSDFFTDCSNVLLHLCDSLLLFIHVTFAFVILSGLFLGTLRSPAGKSSHLGSLVYDVSLCFCHFPI